MMMTHTYLNTDQHAKLMSDLKTAQDTQAPMHEHAIRVARTERRHHSIIASRNLWAIAGSNGHSVVWGYINPDHANLSSRDVDGIVMNQD